MEWLLIGLVLASFLLSMQIATGAYSVAAPIPQLQAMVANTHPAPNAPESDQQVIARFNRLHTHSLVHLRCEACKARWTRDQWKSQPVYVEMEEVEHALTGCNGRVVIDRVHEHSTEGPMRCRCMIPPDPRPAIPPGPPVRYVRE